MICSIASPSIFAFLLFCVSVCIAEASISPFQPASFPLAIRNPYLSAWLPGNRTSVLPYTLPQFWTGQLLGWSALVRIDGKTYSLLGVPDLPAIVEAAEVITGQFTSTHSTFNLAVGSTTIILDFFSPVSPSNLIRQSLPFSYLTISVAATQDTLSSVEIYSDIDQTWAGILDNNTAANVGYSSTASATQVFMFSQPDAVPFSEVSDMATWGIAAYCTNPQGSTLSSALGGVDDVRAQFADNGTIPQQWVFEADSVAAYVHDLGKLEPGTSKNVTFVVGLDREESVSYLGTARASYWKSSCTKIDCGCVRALLDYEDAVAESRNVDALISERGTQAGGENYAGILALSLRQAFGAIDVTLPADSLDTNDVLAFMKEISSNGNVNTIDVIFPASPLFYLISPDYIKLLLEPVMRYLASSRWPHDYMIHDIGNHYPNATGHDDGDAEEMPIEECGNVLILFAMYEQATNDSSWRAQYSTLLQGYADYLVDNGLFPVTQLRTDDGAGMAANQTGLAVKAAVALNAVGRMTSQANYSDIGKEFASNLYNNRIGTDANRTQFTLIQGEPDSWSMTYNLHPDVLLNLATFPKEAYAMQSAYYKQVRKTAGVPLDSRVQTWGKTDWMMFVAAISASTGNAEAKQQFVDDVYGLAANGLNDVPFSDRYVVEDADWLKAGSWSAYKARPVVGGHFALAALAGPNLSWCCSGVDSQAGCRDYPAVRKYSFVSKTLHLCLMLTKSSHLSRCLGFLKDNM